MAQVRIGQPLLSAPRVQVHRYPAWAKALFLQQNALLASVLWTRGQSMEKPLWRSGRVLELWTGRWLSPGRPRENGFRANPPLMRNRLSRNWSKVQLTPSWTSFQRHHGRSEDRGEWHHCPTWGIRLRKLKPEDTYRRRFPEFAWSCNRLRKGSRREQSALICERNLGLCRVTVADSMVIPWRSMHDEHLRLTRKVPYCGALEPEPRFEER